MNKHSIRILFLIAFLTSCGRRESSTDGSPHELNGKISISGAFALYPLAVMWAEEFKKLHPNVAFDIQGGGAGKGMADVLSETVDIGMVSRDINEEEIRKGAYGFAVAKDAVVATCNEMNPHLPELHRKGMSRSMFRKIWIEGSAKTWGQLLGTSSTDVLEVYTRSDAAGAPETWAKYLGGKQEDLLGTGVFGDPGVAEVVSKTKFAIGFNNVNYVYDYNTKKPFSGLQVVPIDVNENGMLDAEENFYTTVDNLNDAISDGKFPSPPARELYFVTKSKSTNTLVKEFLNWALTEGQKSVRMSGYVPLPDSIIIAQRKKLE